MYRETIIKLASEAGWPDSLVAPVIMDKLADFAKLVAEHEREACAKLCEAQENRVVQRHPARIEFDPNSIMARKCADTIRARSNT
jgi:hypothetical protein